MKIDIVAIDSTDAKTSLCETGASYGTDKSPYTQNGGHRHPYTAAYNVLFSALRHREIVFGELGILDNASMKMWRDYFTSAHLYGFDAFPERLDAAAEQQIPRSHYAFADVTDKRSMYKAFNDVGKLFDILIDDSTHQFSHQVNFIEVAIDFVRTGGLIIVEDVFRGWPVDRYNEALRPLARFFDSVFLMDTKHEKAFSGGTQEPYYDNDRILVLCRSAASR